MEKPKRPIEPHPRDYDTPLEFNGVNSEGKPLFVKLDFIADYKKYRKDYIKYKEDMETYQQLKYIKIIKYSKEKLILKKYKIIKL